MSILQASPPSKIFSKVGKEATEKLVKEALQKAVKEAAEHEIKQAERRVVADLGADGLKAITNAAIRVGKDPREIIVFASKYGDDLSKILQAGDEGVLDMVVRNGEAGRFLASRFLGSSSFKAGAAWFNKQADEAIQEAWKIVAPGRIDGSWNSLRRAMTRAELNGPDRDFCEILFANRVKAGRIPGLKPDELIDGHLGNLRTGFDFIGVDTKTGRVNIIEFSTGRKPSSTNPEQMTDEWIKKHWSQLVSDPESRTMLREKGVNPGALNPRLFENPDFELSSFFDKTFCAPDINLAAARDLGARAIILP